MNKFAEYYLREMEKLGVSSQTLEKMEKILNVATPVVGGTSGYLMNRNSDDPMMKWYGAGTGAGMAVLGRSASKGLKNMPALRYGAPAAAALAGDIGGPKLVGKWNAETNAAIAQKEESLAHAALEKAQRESILSPPGPAVKTPGAAPTPAPPPVTVNNNTPGILGGMGPVGKGLLAAGAAGLTGAGIYNLIQAARANKRKADGLETPPSTNVVMQGGGGETGAGPEPSAPSLGTLRVSLPARGSHDHDTQVEMPLERIGLSNALLTKIKRDTKRRLRNETNSRTHHISPPAPAIQGLN